jgi:hypothetical protein
VKIVIYDYALGNLLESTGYTHNQVIEGTPEDAVRIAGEIFLKGPNVMITHRQERNEGTRKNPVMTPASILIMTDNQRFQQR